MLFTNSKHEKHTTPLDSSDKVTFIWFSIVLEKNLQSKMFVLLFI